MQDGSGGDDGSRLVLDAVAFEGIGAEVLGEAAVCVGGSIDPFGEGVVVRFWGKVLGVEALFGLVVDDFCGLVLLEDALYLFYGSFCGDEFACGDIDEGDTLASLGVEMEGGEIVVLCGDKGVVVVGGPWGDDFGYGSFDDFFSFLWDGGLVGDGDGMPCLDDFG